MDLLSRHSMSLSQNSITLRWTCQSSFCQPVEFYQLEDAKQFKFAFNLSLGGNCRNNKKWILCSNPLEREGKCCFDNTTCFEEKTHLITIAAKDWFHLYRREQLCHLSCSHRIKRSNGRFVTYSQFIWHLKRTFFVTRLWSEQLAILISSNIYNELEFF